MALTPVTSSLFCEERLMAVKTKGIREGIIPEELRKLLLSLALNWGDVIDYGGLKVDHLSGAMTNEVYRISWPCKKDDGAVAARNVLVRVYGDGVELFFNRDEEIQTFECLSEYSYGPKILGHFKGGRVEEFIYARTLSAADLRDSETAALIAAKMREVHNLEMPGPKESILWNRLRKWLFEARNLCSPEHAKTYHLDTLEQEITLLEKAISMDHQEIGFCHNDMQYGNIMINDNDKAITITDYEYASYNPVAYDIANHFCEMAANYHTDTPHILDYTKYPDLDERKRFIQNYLRSSGNEASEAAVDKLADDVEKYTLANHIFWGLWGLISAYVNHIDFDYKEYARQRFEQYWLRKAQILNVQGRGSSSIGFIRRLLSKKYCFSDVSCVGESSLKVVDLEMPFPDETFKVVGYCNGVFCLEYGNGKIVVWKPHTSDDKSSLEVVPYPSSNLLAPPISLYCSHYGCTYTPHSITAVCGFGQDINTHDYKVVTLVNTYFDVGGTQDDIVKQFFVYTLGNDNGRWEEIKCQECMDLAGVIDSSGTWANGCCYWIAEAAYDTDILDVFVVSLDLATLDFSLIGLPNEKGMGANYIIMESKGDLDLIMFKKTDPGYICTWILNATCSDWECKRSFQFGSNIVKPLGYLGDKFILEGLDEELDESHLIIYDYVHKKFSKSDLVVGCPRSMQLFIII